MSHDDLKIRRAEEQYFLEQNRELLRKIKEEQAAAMAHREQTSHLGHCSQCGEKTEEVVVAEHKVIVCHHCAHASLPVGFLTLLLSTSKGRMALMTLEQSLLARKSKSA